MIHPSSPRQVNKTPGGSECESNLQSQELLLINTVLVCSGFAPSESESSSCGVIFTAIQWYCFCFSVNLMFLMSYWSVNRTSSEGAEALQMTLHTLRMMALGGIHDHVAQVS